MTHDYQFVKSQFASYLSKPAWNWTWFVTQTYDINKCGFTRKDGKRAFHSQISKESFDNFIKRVGQASASCWGFVFEERHKTGRPHWHALLHVTENLFGDPRRDVLWKYMFEKYGRMEIRPFNCNRGAATDSDVGIISDGISRYLCKYLAKDSRRDDAWWDFRGFTSGFEAEARQIRELIGIDSMDLDSWTQKGSGNHEPV